MYDTINSDRNEFKPANDKSFHICFVHFQPLNADSVVISLLCNHTPPQRTIKRFMTLQTSYVLDEQ